MVLPLHKLPLVSPDVKWKMDYISRISRNPNDQYKVRRESYISTLVKLQQFENGRSSRALHYKETEYDLYETH